jgi:hypothetical protein
MADWRLDEVDNEVELTDEELFGPARTPDPMTAAINRVMALLEEAEADPTDFKLAREWAKQVRRNGSVEEARRYGDYLAA